MKTQIIEKISIPEGVDCKIEDNSLICKSNEVELVKEILIPRTRIELDSNEIKIICDKGNKRNIAHIKTFVAHIKNIFKGLNEKFNYKLEICNVHFPMTVKMEGNELIISNFLGEKHKRKAKILKGVEVEINGNQIVVSGHDVESAGQTAANIEKATRVSKKDRRIFQDGIFMTSKKGREI